MRASRRLRWAGRAGRRLNDKESLMVHWGRPTTPAMARRHKLQLALLLEMDKKESAQHTIGNGCLQLASGLIEAELAA
eukprot:scaffold35051_cov65-Phaeocystis_antarctica.AAC.11